MTEWWLNFHLWVNVSLKSEVVQQLFFTQYLLCVALQPACTWLSSLCLEPVTSSHWPPARSFLQSHTSASSLQGAVTFQLSPVPTPLTWHSATETDTLCCILSKTSENKKTLLVAKTFIVQVHLALRLTSELCFYLVGVWMGRIPFEGAFPSTTPANRGAQFHFLHSQSFTDVFSCQL